MIETVQPINAHTNYNQGDITLINNSLHIYNGNAWYEIYSAITPNIEILNKCVNCGAPTDINGYCPYCGTYNRKAAYKTYAR